MQDQATQIFVYPTILKYLVDSLTYKDNVTFALITMGRGQGSEGLTLRVRIRTPNSYNPAEMRTVDHLFPVPPAAYDERSWRRWLLDQVLLMERHEACEFFEIAGVKPYAPSHGPGNDPYLIREVGTDEDVRTSNRGIVKDEVDMRRVTSESRPRV